MRMYNSILLLCSITFVNYGQMFTNATDNISKKLSAEGYPNEVHVVTTADKYILNLHRIPSPNPLVKPVIMVHGMGGSGTSFLITGPGIPRANSIAFKLADNGYDVWLVNVRGTDFSMKHQYLESSTSQRYWEFSFHEIAKYDLPAIIDYVLAKTNRKFAHCVGHSQGTTIILAMLSMFPRYNRKLKTVHLMAPAVYLANTSPFIKTAVMFYGPLKNAAAAVGLGKIPINLSLELLRLVGYLCSSKSLTTLAICKKLIDIGAGQMGTNEAIFTYPTPVNVFQEIPNTISFMQLLHFAQLLKAGGDKFLQFDHSPEKNLLIYNQSTPPMYNLSNVKTKIHFIYGTTDAILNYRDVERLIKQLRPWTIGVDKIIGYNHIDVILGKNVDEFVNTKILRLINRHSHQMADFICNEYKFIFLPRSKSYGAERDRQLHIPNEYPSNVLSAREFEAWYNGLPGTEQYQPNLNARTVAIVGQGNVAIDVSRILLSPIDVLAKTDITHFALQALSESKVEKVYLIGRGGPLQAAFTIKELREMTKLPGVNILWRGEDFVGIQEELPNLPRPRKRLTELMLSSFSKQQHEEGKKLFIPMFLRSPQHIDVSNNLVLSINNLVGNSAVATSATETLETDLIMRSIGYKSICLDKNLNFDEKQGLVNNVVGRVLKKQLTGSDNSIDDIEDKFEKGLYVSGWLGTGPTGVILTTMNNSFAVAHAVCEDFKMGVIGDNSMKPGLDDILTNKTIVTWEGWKRIDKAEMEAGRAYQKPREKIVNVNKMLEFIT